MGRLNYSDEQSVHVRPKDLHLELTHALAAVDITGNMQMPCMLRLTDELHAGGMCSRSRQYPWQVRNTPVQGSWMTGLLSPTRSPRLARSALVTSMTFA